MPNVWQEVVGLGLTAIVFLSSIRPVYSDCSQNHLVLTCTGAHRMDVKKLTEKITSFDMNVEFMVNFILIFFCNVTRRGANGVLKSQKSLCNCRAAALVANITRVDVIVVTTSKCHWKDIQDCRKEIQLDNLLVTMSGLVIQKNDSKLHWAATYHLKQQWEAVETIRKSSVRTSVYKGINLDINGFIKDATTNKSLKRLTAKVFKQIKDNSKFDEEGNKKVKKEESMQAELVNKDLELIRELPDVDSLMGKNGKGWEKNTELQSDEELQYTLDNELKDIKSFFHGNKGKKKVKRSEARVEREKEDFTGIRDSIHSTNNGNASSIYLFEKASCSKHQGTENRNHSRLKRRSRKTKFKSKYKYGRSRYRPPKRYKPYKPVPQKKVKVKPKQRKIKKPKDIRPLYIFPYKLYAGGDFVSLYDSFAVHVATSKDVSEKYKNLAMQLEKELSAEREMEKNMEKAKEDFVKEQRRKAEEALAASSTNVPAVVIPIGVVHKDDGDDEDEDKANEDENDRNEDKQKEPIEDDEDDDEFDDDFDDEEDDGANKKNTDARKKGAVAGHAGVVAGLAAVKTGESRNKTTNATAIGKGKTKTEVTPVSSTRDYDHRIRGFVIFFIAIIGIVVIMSVLLIMAVRGNGSLEGMYVGGRPKKRPPIVEQGYDKDDFATLVWTNEEEKPLLNGVTLTRTSEQFRSFTEAVAPERTSQIADNNSDSSGKRTPEISEEETEKKDEDDDQSHVTPQGRLRHFKSAREDMKETSPLLSPQSPTSLKRLHTPDNRPKISTFEDHPNPFPKTQLGGKHVIVDFGRERTSKGKEMQRISPTNQKMSENRMSSDTDSSTNNAVENGKHVYNPQADYDNNENHGEEEVPDEQFYTGGVRSWEGRQERSLVSFLESIDSQNRGILRYDHRSGSPWI